MTVPRRMILLSGLGLLAQGAAPALAADPPVAIVMNSAGATISVIDMATHRTIRTVPVLREPHHWALTPDGRELLVGDASGNALFRLDPRTGRSLGHRVISDPYQLWFSPDSKWLVVNALRLNHVDVYDAQGLRLHKRFYASSMPSHLAFSPDGSMVYSTLQGTGKVVAIDLTRMAVAWSRAVGPAPAGIIWHGEKLLCALMGGADVVELDPVDGHTTRRIPTGKGAHIIFPSPDGQVIYVGNRVAGTITRLDARTLKVEHLYTVPGGPDCIAFAPDGMMWISRRWADSIAVMDPASGRYGLVATGRSPHGVFLSTILPAAARNRAVLGTFSA